jgi:2-C-methyl-D-erythritol 2,4-cyclodiphosphate synthase
VTSRSGIGQDSHRFEPEAAPKPLVLGGVRLSDHGGLQGNSDADVVLHALANAISGVTGVDVIGAASDEMCRAGVTDSREYVRAALAHLRRGRVVPVSIAIECKRPLLAARLPEMKRAIAVLVGLAPEDVGITATSGEGLTAFGRGEGVQAFCVVSVETER